MKFRSKYRRFRLVLESDVVKIDHDGIAISFTKGGKAKGIPGTIEFSEYEYRPPTEKVYNAIVEKWNDMYGGLPGLDPMPGEKKEEKAFREQSALAAVDFYAAYPSDEFSTENEKKGVQVLTSARSSINTLSE